MEYGLLGGKLGHSYSKEIHGLLADYQYDLVELSPDELAPFMKNRAYLGVNVTIPYKRAAFEVCDEVSDSARRLQNVNTVIREKSGRLVGHNTDYFGFSYMLKRCGVDPRGEKAAVLGASGGAALTAAAVLHDLGAVVIPVSRKGPVDYEALYKDYGDVEIVVNATPVGMYPDTDSAPVDLSRLRRVKSVLEIIYNPHRTRLMIEAGEMNIPSENGLSMLIAQAARAKALFTGEEVREDAIEEIRATLCREKLNIVLIGMPGSGKTSVGKLVAGMTGRDCFDTDEMIEAEAGMSIPEVFRKYGEARFREMEREAAQKCALLHRSVIITGGGAPMDKRNVAALSKNGVIVQMDRPLKLLATEGRPLSVNEDALYKMERERGPVYGAAARFKVLNDKTVDDAAKRVLEGFHEAACD